VVVAKAAVVVLAVSAAIIATSRKTEFGSGEIRPKKWAASLGMLPVLFSGPRAAFVTAKEREVSAEVPERRQHFQEFSISLARRAPL
jgi:hypothetical protein